MQYRWLEEPTEFREIAERWNQTVLGTGNDNPFFLADFILTWWRHYSNDLRLRIFLVSENGNILGGVPLCQDRRGYLEYPGGWAANYTELLARDGAQEVVWQALARALREVSDWRRVRLPRYRGNRLSSEERTYLELGCGEGEGDMWCSIFTSDRAYLIDMPQNASELFQRLPKKLRYYLRRSHEKCAEMGGVVLCSIEREEQIDEWFADYVRLSTESFAKRGQQSAFDDMRYCAFFRELLHRFFSAGYLDGNVLKLNDRIIAVHFGYTLNNNLSYVLTAFDSELYDLNPGHLLIYKLIERAAQRGSRQFDFYTGYHLYKSQWSNRQEDIVTVEIWRDGLRNRVEWLIRTKLRESQAAGRLIKTLRSFKMLRRAAHRARALMNYRR